MGTAAETGGNEQRSARRPALTAWAGGQGNVGQRGLDVLDGLPIVTAAPVRLDLALVLMQEGDDVDQGEVLLMIAAQARGLVGEGQELRVGAGDIAIAGAPEGQRVDEGFAENNFRAGG